MQQKELVFDPAASINAVKREILSYRRAGKLDKTEARARWNEIIEHLLACCNAETFFEAFLNQCPQLCENIYVRDVMRYTGKPTTET